MLGQVTVLVQVVVIEIVNWKTQVLLVVLERELVIENQHVPQEVFVMTLL